MPASDDRGPKGKARPDLGLATTAGDGALAPTLDSDPSGSGLASTVQSGSGDTIASPGAIPAVIAGRYRVGARLGRGGFGAVYEATDQRIDKKVAVKILDEQRARTEAGIKQFRAEALAASRLRHPGIIAVSDYDLLPDGRPFLVMEFAVGETLQAVLERGPLDVDRAVKIACDLAAALEVAHKAGIVHRDLKPGNVMVEDGAVVPIKILDFGIAKMADAGQSGHVTDANSMVGTPHYMAPEQIKDTEKPIGPHTDVYALGCVVYELLTAKPPFAHIRNVAELLLAQLGDPPPPLPASVPEHVSAAVMRALEKDPANRFRHARDFADALRGSTPAPVVKRASSRRPLAIALAGLVLAGGAAAAFVMTRPEENPAPKVTLDWNGPWHDGVTEEQKNTAMRQFSEGNALLSKDRNEESIEHFQLALAAWDHPAIHYNASLAFAKLGRLPEAVAELELALAYGGAGLSKETVMTARTNLTLLRAEVAKTAIDAGVVAPPDAASVIVAPDAGVATPKKPPKKPPKRGSGERLPDAPKTTFEVPK